MSMTGMLQRCWEHDYCAPSFYLITVVTEPRRECLSRLHEEQGGAPELVLSPIGEVVHEVWKRTNIVYKNVKACESVIMPDHFHGILWVQERLERPMGHIVKAFKRVSRQECGSKGPLPPPDLPIAGSVSAAAPAAEFSTLWHEGFQDSILLRRGQLQAMAHYIEDNPRRLAVTRANPALFTVASRQPVCPGLVCPVMGNRFLLDHPLKRRIQISRSVSTEELAEKRDELLYAAEHGSVLVSPCISPGEKEIARAVLEAGRPLIVLVENGFAPHYKPPGRYFDACAEGRLLMVAPFPYHRQRRTITREQCVTLNHYAQAIAESRPCGRERLAGS
jgi:REP element-mobilizing transposase RayT